ncbi:MAG: DUF1858 domain-containing protein [Clostridia bacterium]
MKTINLSDTVYNLCEQNSGLDLVLKEIGFPEIVNPVMRNTAGRFMTLEKGAKLRGVEIEILKNKLQEHGYSVEEGDNNE